MGSSAGEVGGDGFTAEGENCSDICRSGGFGAEESSGIGVAGTLASLSIRKCVEAGATWGILWGNFPSSAIHDGRANSQLV